MNKNKTSSDLDKYISLRLGLSPGLAKKIIQVIYEYLAIELGKHNKVLIPKIGTFLVKASTVKLHVSSYLTSYIFSSEHPFIQQSKLEEFEESLKKDLRIKHKYPSLELSFLLYLQTDFAYSKPWQTPFGTYIPSIVIKRALEIYKQVDPDGYGVLWIIWVKLEERLAECERKDVKITDLRAQWLRIASKLMVMVLHPELTPSKYKQLFKEKKERQELE